MRPAIGADGAGKPLPDVIAKPLAERGVDATDPLPASGSTPEFCADTAERVGLAIVEGRFDRGLLVCGTGIGVCIPADEVPGIRAAQAHDTRSVGQAATSNDAQIIALGARVVGPELAKAVVDAYPASAFGPQGSSAGDVGAIGKLDGKRAKG